jgi:hypothetical protein
MATANFSIKAEDGWVAVTSADNSFIRIRSNTPNHAFFVTSGTSAPADTVIGYKVICHEFWCNVAAGANVRYYVRTLENRPAQNRIDVFTI